MTKRNPKQEGSNVWECKPQIGNCPMNCNQCFYNRPNAFYVDINEPHLPKPEEVGDGIMRVNCGHDSNIQRDLAIEATECYPHRFFNTALPRFDFPAPIVFTANRDEEVVAIHPCAILNEKKHFDKLMFVRLRISATNLKLIDEAVRQWTEIGIPIVLTFMAYYDHEPKDKEKYIWKKRHINSYWCATDDFMREVMKREKAIGGRLVVMCGNIDSYKCKDCHNCETYYWQTIKHMKESNDL